MKPVRSIAALTLLFTLLALTTTALPATARPFLLQGPPAETPTVGLRFLRPNLSHSNTMSTFSGTYDFYLTIPASRTNLIVSVPMIKVANGFSERSIGNVFVGGEIPLGEQGRAGSDHFTLGFFLPTAESSEANFFGLLTNTDELYKYVPDYLTLFVNGTARRVVGGGGQAAPDGGLYVAPDAGLQFMIPTKDGPDGEFYLRYSGALGFETDLVDLQAGLLGLYAATSEGDFADKFIHSFQAGARLRNRIVRPSVFLRVPLDDDVSEIVDYSLGIQVEFSVPQE